MRGEGGDQWQYLPHFLSLYCLTVGVQTVPHDRLGLFFAFQGTFTIALLALVESCWSSHLSSEGVSPFMAEVVCYTALVL